MRPPAAAGSPSAASTTIWCSSTSTARARSTSTAEASKAGATLNLTEFLPAQHGYYTFDGSLTTPPCSEHVRWFVLKTPVQASADQVRQFGARYPNDARPTQPLNDRQVVQTRN